MSHRRAQKDEAKRNKPVTFYLTRYDRLFYWIGTKLLILARWIGRKGIEGRTKKDKRCLWWAGKIGPLGYRIQQWRYPPRSRRTKPC